MPTEKQGQVGTDETMGKPVGVKPVKLFVGMLAGCAELLDEAECMLVEAFSGIDVRSPDLCFDFTEYYTPSMGPGLLRRFVSFVRLIDPAEIADIKLATNEMEETVACRDGTQVARPVNLDPGYLSPAKVVLVTSKNQAHRIYLGRGIYAEVTLSYHGGRYHPGPWTYQDYRTEDYQTFFAAMRERLF